MVRLRITKGQGGEDLVPVFWDDNYVSLLPGEQREIGVMYDRARLGGSTPVVKMDGWNVAPESLEVKGSN